MTLTESWLDPRTDGKGAWPAEPAAPLRLGALGTLLVLAVMAVLFLGALAVGERAMCATHRDAAGHGALRYCADYRGGQP